MDCGNIGLNPIRYIDVYIVLYFLCWILWNSLCNGLNPCLGNPTKLLPAVPESVQNWEAKGCNPWSLKITMIVIVDKVLKEHTMAISNVYYIISTIFNKRSLHTGVPSSGLVSN
jgi:hypothetical protein